MRKIKNILNNESRKLLNTFNHSTFLYLTIIGNGILIFCTLIVYHIEKNAPHSQMDSYFDALWWGISTITTVGYGDILPQTLAGRIIGIALMYTGTVIFISFTGVLLSILTKEEVEEEIAPLRKDVQRSERGEIYVERTLREILKRLDRLEKKK